MAFSSSQRADQGSLSSLNVQCGERALLRGGHRSDRGDREVPSDLHTRSSNMRTYGCLASILIITLTGGSSNTFGLYGPRLIRDLHFSQYHVGAISTTMMASVYVMIPVFGRVCQLTSPRTLSALSAFLFGGGYLAMERLFSAAPGHTDIAFPFAISLIAFAAIGSATSAVVMASIAACARTFEGSPRKGLFMSIPIATMGVSGMLHGRIAVTFFSTPSAGNSLTHELSVAHFFRFLAVLSFVAGLLGSLGLNTPRPESVQVALSNDSEREPSSLEAHDVGYGTSTLSHTDPPTLIFPVESQKAKSLSSLLRDPVLWYISIANLLLQGICEVYNMNMGSIIQANLGNGGLIRSVETIVAQHITNLAISSTFARIAGGFLFDRFPAVRCLDTKGPDGHVLASLVRSPVMIFLTMGSSGICGLLLLTFLGTDAGLSMLVVTTLVGLAYGASSSLAPLTTMIWTQQQFPIAYGIINMTPAAGIGLLNFIYSHFYDQGAISIDAGTCLGWGCYGLWAQWSAVAGTASLVAMILAWWTLRKQGITI